MFLIILNAEIKHVKWSNIESCLIEWLADWPPPPTPSPPHPSLDKAAVVQTVWVCVWRGTVWGQFKRNGEKKQMEQRRKKKFYLNTFDKKGQGHIGMQLSAAWAWTLQLLLLIWTQVEPHWMCVWNRMWTVLCVNQQPEFSWCETRSTPSSSTSQLLKPTLINTNTNRTLPLRASLLPAVLWKFYTSCDPSPGPLLEDS